MKSDRVFLLHVLDEIDFLLKESKGQTFDEFVESELTKRAYSRSLEVIGEAVKNLSPRLKKKYPQIEWKKIAGLRDKIIHHYFNVNYEIVWDTIKNKLPDLKKKVKNILKNLESNDRKK